LAVLAIFFPSAALAAKLPTGPEYTNSIGRSTGTFRVTRGGNVGATAFYKCSANRSGTISDDKSPLIGFRVVIGAMPKKQPLPPVKAPYQQNVVQKIPASISKGPALTKPFLKIRTYVNIPSDATGPLFYYHNHNPDITQCPNGDLLAIHFSTITEGDREMVYACSRLRYGSENWDKSEVYQKLLYRYRRRHDGNDAALKRRPDFFRLLC